MQIETRAVAEPASIILPAAQNASPSDLGTYGIRPWQDIIDSDVEMPKSLVESLIEEGSITLFVARQKEGKSMLSAQLAIDLSYGEPFLERLKTKKGISLYIDYENRTHRLKSRGLDLANGRRLEGVYFAAYNRIADRDLGLDGAGLDKLTEAVKTLQPDLLIIDPLRLATPADLMDANKVVLVLEKASRVQEANPAMAILLVHHLKKRQGDGNCRLRNDPREWIENAFGSQALLAHVETIIGLEQDQDRCYTLATVPRSYEPIVWALDKAPNSERFRLAKASAQLDTWPEKLREHWAKLPTEFSWTEGEALVGNSTLDRIVRRAKPLLLTQHPQTRKYCKVVYPN